MTEKARQLGSESIYANESEKGFTKREFLAATVLAGSVAEFLGSPNNVIVSIGNKLPMKVKNKEEVYDVMADECLKFTDALLEKLSNQ